MWARPGVVDRRVLLPMNTVDVVVTPWKWSAIWAYSAGAGWCRWPPRAGTADRLSGLFWTMSILGSVLLLSYFIWGKNDSVGVLELVPMTVALYNLFMHYRSRSNDAPSPA